MNENESYIYGLLITDGSMYLSTRNKGKVTLVTKSEFLKEAYIKFLKEDLGLEKHVNRNKRDGVYNIFISGPNAIKLAKLIDNLGIYLNRKYNKALEMNK